MTLFVLCGGVIRRESCRVSLRIVKEMSGAKDIPGVMWRYLLERIDGSVMLRVGLCCQHNVHVKKGNSMLS